MKKILCFSFLLVVAGCVEEKVEPRLEEDLKTSASAYRDQFLTIQITTNYEDDMVFYLEGLGGDVSVDWGDGTTEDFVIGEGYVTLEHDFNREEENPEDFTIRVSGDIKTITAMDWFYDGFYITDIHFGGLTNLKRLSMGILQHGPSVINLSRNRLLESLTLTGIQPLENVIMPATNKIRSIDIAGTNKLPVSVVDRIIARVHDSVVISPRSGHFSLPISWAQEEGDMTMVGPPSSYSINKLRKLRDRYGWGIYPDVP
jgi:hypothetical protein